MHVKQKTLRWTRTYSIVTAVTLRLRSRQTDYCNVFKDLPKLTICRLITLDFVRVS